MLCLNMIVKNESRVILRLLESVAPWIDDYVISDTGSTDGTPQMITDFFEAKRIPGLVFSEPFVNFEHNRNVALHRAVEDSASTYILFLDADMELIVPRAFPTLECDYYQLVQGTESFRYLNTRIIRRNLSFFYCGVTHEYINVPEGATQGLLSSEDVFVHDIGDGGSKGNKIQRDIQLLEDGVAREPQNVRYYFYLANTYRDAGEKDKAIQAYLRRIALGGWEEEVFMSYYNLGKCYMELKQDSQAIVAWLDAYQVHPRRLESLYELTKYYRWLGKHHLAAMCYEQARASRDTYQPNPELFLFAEMDVYHYLFDVERLICAYYLKSPCDVDLLLVNILTHGKADDVANAMSNAKFYKYTPPGETLCLDITHEGLFSSSLCFIPDSTGYLCNQRFVNYYITEDGSYQDRSQPNNTLRQVITRNAVVRLDAAFNVVRREFLPPSSLPDAERSYYVGVEDIKLFRHKNVVYYVGTQYDPSKRRLGVAMGTYLSDEPPRALTPAWDPNFSCEKNWVFVELGGALKLIYKWHPLWVVNVKGEKELEMETPAFLRHARGSTCGFLFDSEWWFVVHFVSYESPRHYYHMVVVLSEELKVLRRSRIFTFEGAPIEYCLGLLVEETSCVFGYSTWDRSSRVKRIQKNDLFR